MNDIDVSAAVKYVTNTDSIKVIEEKFPEENENYTIQRSGKRTHQYKTNLSLDTLVIF